MKHLYSFSILLCLLGTMQSLSAQKDEALLAKLKSRYDRAFYISLYNAYSVKSGDKEGIVDANGKTLMAPNKYNKVFLDFDRNTKEVFGFKVQIGNKVGYCDVTGREIIPPDKYTEVFDMRNSNTHELEYFKVKIDDKEGYCDVTGREIIPPDKYTSVYASRNSNTGELEHFTVKIGDKEGYCDASGKEIIPPNKYTSVYASRNYSTRELEYFKVKIGDNEGYCDASGKEIIPPNKYTSVYASRNYSTRELEYFKVKIGDKEGICDQQGKILFPVSKYTSVYPSRNKQGEIEGFSVKIDEKVGYCDASGRELVPAEKYTSVYVCKDKQNNVLCFTVKIGKKAGLLNAQANEIIPCEYNSVNPMIIEDKIEGIWTKMDNGDGGFCHADGSVMIPCTSKYTLIQYCWLEKVHNLPRFIVKAGGKYGMIDTLGNPVTKIAYDTLMSPSEGLCVASKGGKWGYLNYTDLTVAIPFEYDQASPFQQGSAKVVKDGNPSMLSNPLSTYASTSKKPAGKAVSTFPAANSEVDKDIPKGKKSDAHTYAFIIANENYPVAKVPYALNDGWTFEKYCKQSLGIPSENVYLFEDATGGNIAACVEQMKQAATSANGNATIIFYYAGHAFPDEDSKSGYLLPIDGDSKNITTGYSLEKLYRELNSVATKQVVCFIDACFSGTTRDDQILIAGRGVAIKVKEDIPQGNMVVMTSATGAETAHAYEEMHHGLFTYYLLEKLQQANGNVTLGDLSEHVTKMVKRTSVLINQKKQTPTVIPSPKLQTTWQDIKL